MESGRGEEGGKKTCRGAAEVFLSLKRQMKCISMRWRGGDKMFASPLHREEFSGLTACLRIAATPPPPSLNILTGPSWLWHTADKWSIVSLGEVYGKVSQTNHHLLMKQKLGGSLRTWTPIDFPSLWPPAPVCVEWIIFLTSLAESEIWYEATLRCALWFVQAAQASLFFGGERYPLPQDTLTVMRSFRLACQVQFNWLARLERRYQRGAILIRIWRGSHVRRFIRPACRWSDFL